MYETTILPYLPYRLVIQLNSVFDMSQICFYQIIITNYSNELTPTVRIYDTRHRTNRVPKREKYVL